MQKHAPSILIVTALLSALAVACLAHAQETKTVAVVLQGASQKIVSIPNGFQAVSAQVTLLVPGGQEAAVRVMVGSQGVDLSWPDDISATLNLTNEPGASYAIPVVAISAQAIPYSVSLQIACIRAGQQ